MAWTTPKTWSSEPLTSSDLNTYIRDNQAHLLDRVESSAEHYFRSSGDYSTTSLTMVDVDATNMNFTITTTGGDVLVGFRGWVNSGTSGYELAVDLDSGSSVTIMMSVPYGTSFIGNTSFIAIFTGLSTGSHTFKLQFRRFNTGAMTLYAGCEFFAVETVGDF